MKDYILYFIRNYSLLGLIVLPFLLAGLISHVSLVSIIAIIMVHLFVLLIPGMHIYRLVSVPDNNSLSCLLTSYAIGFALFVSVYAILLVFGLQQYIIYYGLLIGFISFGGLFYFFSKYSIQYAESHDYKFVLCIFYLILLLGCILFQIPHLSADIVGYWEAHPDHTFMLKGSIASVHSYPVSDLSAVGAGFYWHMFSLFTIAGMHYMTGIDCFTLYFTFSYVWNAILLVGGAYFICRVVLQQQRYRNLCMIMLLFSSGFEGFTYVQYLTHFYGCTLGCAQAVAAMMYCIGFLWLATKQNSKLILVLLSILFYAITMGSKTPHGAVVVVSLFSLLLFCKNTNLKWKYRISYMIIILAIFIAIAVLFALAPAGGESFHHGGSLYLKFDSFLTNGVGTPIFSYLKGLLYMPVAALITLPISFFSMNLVACIYLVIGVSYWLKSRKIFDGYILALLGPAAAGIVLFGAFYVPGFSQSYFAECAMVFAILFICYIKETQITVLPKGFGVKTFYVLLFISIAAPFITAYDSFRLVNSYYNNEHNTSQSDGWSITSQELVGLQWVKKHLVDNELLCTNKMLAADGDRSFVTSCITEHQMWIEGYLYGSFDSVAEIENRLALSEEYYGSPSELSIAKMRKEGVSYSVHYKSINDLTPLHGDVVFENEAIAIVKL